jgi:pullulanase/glycogen debranching enzyme
MPLARPSNRCLRHALAAIVVGVGLAGGGAASAAAPPFAAPATVQDCDAATHARTLVAAPGLDVVEGQPRARALWLSGSRLRWPGVVAPGQRLVLAAARAGGIRVEGGRLAGFDRRVMLEAEAAPLPPAQAARFEWFAKAGARSDWRVPGAHRAGVREALRGEVIVALEDLATGRVLDATRAMHAAALDDLYATAATAPGLGIAPAPGGTRFALWAPTAQAVSVCVYTRGDEGTPAERVFTLRREAATGVWRGGVPGSDLSGRYATYLVDVFVPGTGLVRNRVTDPYSVSLGTDGRRTWIGRLDDPRTKPAGWGTVPRPVRVQRNTDMVIHELHVRDHSIGDTSVPAAHRGTYLAFTHRESEGSKHLRAMSEAGLTDVHLLPVFDIASVPERGCVTPTITWKRGDPPASEAPQAAVAAVAARDCFNWGYDPHHFGAPEGSYATDASDGAVRLVEFRAMVMALHATNLRVGMDVVYNHTSAAGQHPQSVLDRIVPGYYQRLSATGAIERSTCCDNTATEHRMMERLMIDTAVRFVRDFGIDSFRFDLMGHQPRDAMERLQKAVDTAAGRPVQLIGEGWNFGEVANGARFVQAAQRVLNGSGIGTFSDRARDALRGGGPGDSGAAVVQRQGWLTGLHTAPNADSAALPPAATGREALARAADLVRVGLAGTLEGLRLEAFDGTVKPLSAIDYNGQPAGYAGAPGEVVNYADNHDNHTLWDIGALKLPAGTPAAERARVQVLGIAAVALSQGVAYYHAGIETLRSKSLDRNSYDSGDWFNRIDHTLTDNHFGTGLPPRGDNGRDWALYAPRLNDATNLPAREHIRFARDAFLDWLRIRAGSTLWRLPTAAAVQQRLVFLDTGAGQDPAVIVGRLDGRGLPGAGFAEIVYALNTDPGAKLRTIPALKGGSAFELHPVLAAPGAADPRAKEARLDAATGTLAVPGRTAVVFVRR